MISKYSEFFAILKQNGLDKEEVILEFTEGRTTSLSSLTDGEYAELIRRMNIQNRKSFTPKPGDVQRKKIIAIARQMKWVIRVGNKWVVDMQRIDNWCIHYGKFKKPLMQHSVAELGTLIVIFEQVYKDFLKDLNR